MGLIYRCFSFLNYFGTANWYHGIDKPTFWQKIYKWRLGFKTSWALAKMSNK